jgi:hypothetical protein
MSESNCVAEGDGLNPVARKLLKFSETTVAVLVETVLTSQLSEAVAVPVADGEVGSVQPTVTSAGATTAGAVESVTVMVWTHCAELPESSVAVHVRVMTLA